MNTFKFSPHWVLIVLSLFILGGCSALKSNSDAYIYVFNRDYDAPINAEWFDSQNYSDGPETLLGYGFEKGHWIHLPEKAQEDTVTIIVDGDKFDVATSALSLLTPQQFEAALKEDYKSPHYLKGLDKYINEHNVMLLSDGSVPERTAKSDASDFYYLFIPALLLIVLGYMCSRRERGSLLLPTIGIVVILSQLAILLWIVSGTGVNINDIVYFSFAMILIALLVAAANLYAGIQMCEAIGRRCNLVITQKLVFTSFGISVALIIVMGSISPSIGVISGIPLGILYFFFGLYKQKHDSIKPILLLTAIYSLTLLFAWMLIIIGLIYFIFKLVYGFISSGGNMLGSATPNNGNCCNNCRYYNRSNKYCNQSNSFIDDPFKERSCHR